MRYELKGRLLEIAQRHSQEYKAWHDEVLDKLHELEPETIGFVLSSSVWTGSRISGIITSLEVALEKWRPGQKPGWWEPNRRFAVGKKASKLFGSLPKEPDLAADILSELGFEGRYFSLPGLRYSTPGFTCLPKHNKAFMEWSTEYPSVSDPDLIEILESYYHQTVEECKSTAPIHA